MRKYCSGLLALVFLVPVAGAAPVSSRDLPDGTVWYLHADLGAMRNGGAGASVYAWFEDEVAENIREDVGIDISSEVDSVTAFADSENGTIVIVEGPLTKDTRDKLLALAAQQGPVDPRDHDGNAYYFFGDEDDIDDNGTEPLEDLEGAVFVSFAIPGKALLTGTEEQMHGLLESGGKVAGSGSHGGALLVLSASKALVQAGMQPQGMLGGEADDGDDDWESNIVRNTKEAALLMADESGQLAIEAQLVSHDPRMAQAIGGIVNGLIGLQAFNSELGSDIQNLIRNTKIEVLENVLSISTVVDPDLLVSILDD
jgi:hypothetical protein